MAKNQSLAAQSGVLAEGLQLPSVFSSPTQPMVQRSLNPYVTFAHPNRKDEWKKLLDKFGNGVQDGEMYLIEPGRITKLDPMKCGWLCHQQYWALTNAAGEVTATSFVQAPYPYKEHVEAVVLVYLEDRCVPANMCFRTTKCPASHDMAIALDECQQPTWAEKSPAHKETLVVAQPFGRFYGLIALGPTRTAKTSGMPYKPTTCQVQPTGIPEWRLLKAFSEGEETQKMLEEAAKRFTSRIDEMKAKQAK